MADPEVKLKFLGNAGDAERAIASLEKKLQGLENASKQLSKAQREGAGDFERGFEQMGRSVLRVVAPMSLASKGLQVIRAEYGALSEMQDKAKDASTGHVKALTNLAM